MTAFYNEIAAYPASWTRNLIAAGHVADGVVDERSIVELDATELVGFEQCHFFAGIGGWSYALRLAGWPDDRPAWTASCPCQPFSTAGKGRGVEDERHLWPVLFELVRECRPAILFGEQVASPAGRAWLDSVSADLESAGYAVGAANLCAAGVGAPHIRQRLYFVAVANADGAGPQGRDAAPERAGSSNDGRLGDADRDGAGRHAGSRDRAEAPGDRARLVDGRDGHDAGASGPWSDAEWIPCTDGKSRPAQPGSFPLLARLPDHLVSMRSIQMAGLEEVNRYGERHKADPREVLRLVREGVFARTGREEQPTGMRVGLPASEVLLAFLLCIEAAHTAGADGGCLEKKGEAHDRWIVRGVRVDQGTRSPSRERRSDGQQGWQPSDALRELSLVLARHAETYRTAAVRAHAASSRRGMLSGYGNAIVPEVAATWIRAVMEVRQ